MEPKYEGQLEIGWWYRVTKGSKDGTFKKGDHVMLEKDGSIACLEAKGWIDSEDVVSATVGMECRLDTGLYKEG